VAQPVELTSPTFNHTLSAIVRQQIDKKTGNVNSSGRTVNIE